MNELNDVLDMLDAVRFGVACVSVPGWPEHDPRWELVAARDRQHRRTAALTIVQEMIADDFKAEIKEIVSRGVQYPLAAQTLGMSLHEFKALVDSP